MSRCLLLTQSGHERLRIAARQTDARNPFHRPKIPVVIAQEAMRRRDFIKAIEGSSVAWALAARAQRPTMPNLSKKNCQGRNRSNAVTGTERRHRAAIG